MSLSSPRTQNPVRKFFKIRSSTGDVVYWDKAAQKEIEVDLPFKFIVLDVLNTIGGFNEPSNSGIWSNEVRPGSTGVLTVRTKKGVIAQGTYSDIKDKIKAEGGKFGNSVYIAYQENGEWVLGNINFIGASVSAWFDFTQGKRLHSDPGVSVTGFVKQKKGRNEYFVPEFDRWIVSTPDLDVAIRIDGELQEHLNREPEPAQPSYTPPPPPSFDDLDTDEPPF